MENNYIELRKERGFGDVFNASFNFIKQEFKNLIKALAIYALPFLLIAAAGHMYYIYSVGNMTSSSYTDMSEVINLYIAMAPMLIGSLLGYCMLFCTIYSYIKVYLDKGTGNIDAKELLPVIKKVFLPVIGIGIISYMMVVIGTMLCIIPGIYLAVVMSIAPTIMVIEGNGFAAIERSFKLIKNNWFSTFGILIVASILTYILMIIISIPSMALGFSNLFTLNAAEMLNTQIFSIPYIVVTALTQIVSYFLGTLPTIIIAFQYFNLAEIHEKPSLNARIDNINQ